MTACFRIGAGLVLVAAIAAGCATGGDGAIGEQDQEARLRACPAIAILCIEGYKPKQLPNCNQICIPDHGAWECDQDKDCGGIYCITTPCPTVACQGHKCVMSNDPPGGGGATCGNTVCGGHMSCCDPYCGVCAPEGAYCTQGCSTPGGPV